MKKYIEGISKVFLVVICIISLYGISADAAEAKPEPEPAPIVKPEIDWKLRALTAEARLAEAKAAILVEREKARAAEIHLANMIRAGQRRKTDPAIRALVKYQKELKAEKE